MAPSLETGAVGDTCDQLVPQETYGHQGTLEDVEYTQVSKLRHERT